MALQAANGASRKYVSNGWAYANKAASMEAEGDFPGVGWHECKYVDSDREPGEEKIIDISCEGVAHILYHGGIEITRNFVCEFTFVELLPNRKSLVLRESCGPKMG